MLSPQTTAEITAREASDFLHKLIIEVSLVQVRLSVGGSPSLSATVVGRLRFAADGTIWVVNPDEPTEAHISFRPSLAILRKLDDDHLVRISLPESHSHGCRDGSKLTFLFADRSQVSVMELSSQG